MMENPPKKTSFQNIVCYISSFETDKLLSEVPALLLHKRLVP